MSDRLVDVVMVDLETHEIVVWVRGYKLKITPQEAMRSAKQLMEAAQPTPAVAHRLKVDAHA